MAREQIHHEDRQHIIRPDMKHQVAPSDLNMGESIWDPAAFADFKNNGHADLGTIPEDFDPHESMYGGDDVHVPPPPGAQIAMRQEYYNQNGRNTTQKVGGTLFRVVNAAVATGKPLVKRAMSKREAPANIQPTRGPGSGPTKYFQPIGDRRYARLTERSLLINVYHLQPQLVSFNKIAKKLDCGVYHACIEAFGREWTYIGGDDRGSGIIREQARCNPNYEFDETLYVGELPHNISLNELTVMIGRMDSDWQMRDYHIIKKNCISFLSQVLIVLGHDPVMIPPKINSLMNIGVKASDQYYENGLDKKFASGVAKAMAIWNEVNADGPNNPRPSTNRPGGFR